MLAINYAKNQAPRFMYFSHYSNMQISNVIGIMVKYILSIDISSWCISIYQYIFWDIEGHLDIKQRQHHSAF